MSRSMGAHAFIATGRVTPKAAPIRAAAAASRSTPSLLPRPRPATTRNLAVSRSPVAGDSSCSTSSRVGRRVGAFGHQRVGDDALLHRRAGLGVVPHGAGRDAPGPRAEHQAAAEVVRVDAPRQTSPPASAATPSASVTAVPPRGPPGAPASSVPSGPPAKTKSSAGAAGEGRQRRGHEVGPPRRHPQEVDVAGRRQPDESLRRARRRRREGDRRPQPRAGVRDSPSRRKPPSARACRSAAAAVPSRTATTRGAGPAGSQLLQRARRCVVVQCARLRRRRRAGDDDAGAAAVDRSRARPARPARRRAAAATSTPRSAAESSATGRVARRQPVLERRHPQHARRRRCRRRARRAAVTVARTGPSSAAKVTRRRPSSGRLELGDLGQARAAQSLRRRGTGTVPPSPGPLRAPRSRTSPPSSLARRRRPAQPSRAGAKSRSAAAPARVARAALVAERLQRPEERVGLAAGDGERREARLESVRGARVAQAQRELQRGLVEDVEDAADVAGRLDARRRARAPPAPSRTAAAPRSPA